MADLFFCPERWEPDSLITTNAAAQIRLQGSSVRTADAWRIGDWNGNWTAVVSQIPMEKGWLESGCEYRFCFWLNGGENSRGDEVCALEIFGDDWENRLVFPLNRERTRPLLRQNGWLLFAVPFTAPQASSALTFRFVSAGAVTTIAGIADMNMTFCERIVSDPPDTAQPMRQNLVPPPEQTPRKAICKAHSTEHSFPQMLLCAAAAAAGITVCTVILSRILRGKRK